MPQKKISLHELVDVSDIFNFFFGAGRGGGSGSPWRQEGVGVGVLLKIPEGGGGVLPREARGGGVYRELWGVELIFFFFSGPKCPPR